MSTTHSKCIVLHLNSKTDADVIEYLEAHANNTNDVIRRALHTQLDKEDNGSPDVLDEYWT